jgi:uncharacterized iron-regulated membrane protein
MKFSTLNRKVHYWLAFACALPVVVILATGLMLQLKKQVSWVQPPEQRGSAKVPSVPFERILELCRSVPAAQIATWEDIHRLDVRPSRGMLKVTAKNNHEIQIDTHSGEILQVAYRRSDIIESLHDGSFFHDAVKLWIFFPAGVLLFVLWLTGIYLFVLPYWVRWRRKGPVRSVVRGPSGAA